MSPGLERGWCSLAVHGRASVLALAWLREGICCMSRESRGQREPEEGRRRRKPRDRHTARKQGLRYQLLFSLLSLSERLVESN